MNTLFSILADAVDFISSFYIGLVIMRFLLQRARADFYNPMSKFIVTLTNPLIVPVRKIIPGLFGWDLASLLVAFLLQMIASFLILFLHGWIGVSLLSLAWSAIISLLNLVLLIYLVSLFVVAIASWIAPYSYNPLVGLLQQLLDPLVRPIRKIIPPVSGIDFSFMVLAFIIYVLRKYALGFLAGLF